MTINPDILSACYWYAAIIGTIVFILKTALPISGDIDTQGDFNFDSDAAFNIFTIESISAFFMSGGWMGWFAFNVFGYGIMQSMLVAALSGLFGMFLFSFLISQLRKLEFVPKAEIKEVEGKKGKAYMDFAPKGISKIQIEFNSKLEILEAKNNTDIEIKAFEPIKVVKVENNEIYIEKD